MVAGSWLYSQTPLLFWRAMAGCTAIGSLATVMHWFVFLILHEPITCSYNCVIEIGFSWRGKKGFPHAKRRYSTQKEWNIERERNLSERLEKWNSKRLKRENREEKERVKVRENVKRIRQMLRHYQKTFIHFCSKTVCLFHTPHYVS